MNIPYSIAHRITVLDIKTQLLVFAMLLLCSKVYSQQEGFFNIYENLDGNYCATFIVETQDGTYIMSAFDWNLGSGVLVLLSNDGTLIKRVPIRNDNVGVMVDGIYLSPNAPNWYCAIGSFHYETEPICKPFVLHFDDELNLMEEYEVDLPGDYKQFCMERCIMTRDGDFLFATSLGQQNGFHRLYMKITADGTLKHFYEASDDCSVNRMINAIFEFPESGYYGDYRSSTAISPNFTMRLFGFGEDFVFDTIKEFREIEDSSYCVRPYTLANGTALSFGDSSLLFADRAGERYNGKFNDYSTLLTMTDLNGNVSKYLVIGSMNDTTDYPMAYNAIDFMKSNFDEIQNKLIYVGCFGTNDGWFPSSRPNHLTIIQIDEEFNVQWKKTFKHYSKYLLPTYLLATNDGGCIVVGSAFQDNRFDLFALKINSDGTLDCDEIIIEDIGPYAFWPNPVQDQLSLKYSPDVQPQAIELYDLQGRLVHSQTTSLESLSMKGLAAGQYVMKVTMEDGKVFTDKVVKE